MDVKMMWEVSSVVNEHHKSSMLLDFFESYLLSGLLLQFSSFFFDSVVLGLPGCSPLDWWVIVQKCLEVLK